MVLLLPAPALAEVTVADAYARTARPGAPTAAAFMVLRNDGDAAVTLVAAESDVAARAELHTHIDAGDGVLQMRKVAGGFEIPAGGERLLQRGGDHVMLMGVTETLETGGAIALTLRFDGADPIKLDVPVDNQRMPVHQMGTEHGTAGH